MLIVLFQEDLGVLDDQVNTFPCNRKHKNLARLLAFKRPLTMINKLYSMTAATDICKFSAQVLDYNVSSVGDQRVASLLNQIGNHSNQNVQCLNNVHVIETTIVLYRFQGDV